MEIQRQEPGQPQRKKWVLIGLSLLGLACVSAIVGGGIYWSRVASKMSGLDGTWRDPANPRHTHQFRPDGRVDSWYSSLPMASFATWERDGAQITVRTTRGWDFVGQLDQGVIRGHLLLRDEKQAVVNTIATVWQRE